MNRFRTEQHRTNMITLEQELEGHWYPVPNGDKDYFGSLEDAYNCMQDLRGGDPYGTMREIKAVFGSQALEAVKDD